MTVWLGILKGLLSLAGVVAKILADRQLLEAGAARAVAEQTGKAIDAVSSAQTARRAVDHSPAAVLRDPDNRDN